MRTGLLLAPLLCALACSSTRPEEPTYAQGEVRPLSGDDLAPDSEVSTSLRALGLGREDPQSLTTSMEVIAVDGEPPEEKRDFDFRVDFDDLDRIAWEIDEITVIFARGADGAATLKEILTPLSPPLGMRFVTNTPMFPAAGARGSGGAFEAEGFFIAYKGEQVDRVDAKGELSVRSAAEGIQELALPGRPPIKAIRISIEIEIDFEQAQVLVEGQPKASEIVLSTVFWIAEEQPRLVALAVSGGRGPVSIKVVDLQAASRE